MITAVALKTIAKPVIRSVDVSPSTSYRTIGVKWWGEGAYERETIDGLQTAAKTLSIVKENDLIINKIWVRHGSIAIAGKNVDGCAASGEFPTFEIDLNQVLPLWLHWYTKTKEFWDKCSELSQGTSGKNRIKPDLFLTVEIPLPPLEEQRRIVGRIEELVGKIAEARGLRERSIEKSQSFVTSLHLSLSESRIIKLREVFTLDEIQEAVIPAKKYPQVGVKGFGGGLFAKESIDSTQTTYKIFNHLYQGALVLSQVKGWEGAVAVCPPNLVGKYVSPEYRTFRCIPEQAIPEYIATLVANPWFWEKLKDLTRGMGGRRERIRPEQFLSLEIPMPTIDKQYKALDVLKKVQECVPIRQKALKELDVILPAILDKAFKGEL